MKVTGPIIPNQYDKTNLAKIVGIPALVCATKIIHFNLIKLHLSIYCNILNQQNKYKIDIKNHCISR